jgi:hypothetical protein
LHQSLPIAHMWSTSHTLVQTAATYP